MKELHKPKKSLGQNFLRDPNILGKIADFAEIEKTDIVLEVGPGEGLLTQVLLTKAERVIAIEKDNELADKLKEKFSKEIEQGKLIVVAGDILELQSHQCTDIFLLENSCVASLQSSSQGISEFADSKYFDKGYVLVGNIPYYITGAIFKKFLEEVENKPKSITFVIQKEVAERIMAKDGKESILSISIKAYGEPKYGGVIKAGSFYPKPKVDSAIISIRGISSEKISEHTKKFFEILKLGFAHKRKLLIRNLGEIAGERSLKEIFEKCEIDEKARAEDLKVEDWVNLTKEF